MKRHDSPQHGRSELTVVLPPPEREQFEREVAEIIGGNGNITTIAQLLHKDRSTVSRAFNPYEPERLNPFFQSMIHLWALDCIDPALGDKLVQMCLRERDKWTPRRTVAADHTKLTCEVGRQYMEAIESEMGGKSIEAQIAEYCDVEEAARKKKEALIAQRNVRHFGHQQEAA